MQESQRLSRMVGNVLDFSRMESGRKTYDFVELDLGAVVRNTLEEFRPVLNQGGFVLALQIPESPPAVRGDGEAIATAVANLMSNAVKYSKDRKEIGVTVAAVAGAAQVEIADRGVGISSEEQTRIFEKFHRAPSAGNTATGTGLGLALVKGIAEAHGGSIDCRSRKGGGTAFALRLPLTET
jgi:signal transduction histidine kinase